MELEALLGIGIALFVGAASPGPSFVLVARAAARAGRTAGLASSLGMAVGGLCFCVACLLGLHAALLAVPSLYTALKVAGGVYLLVLGVRIWRQAGQPMEVSIESNQGALRSPWAHFTFAAVTQLSNPKSALVYASVFAAFMPTTSTMSYKLFVAALVFSVELGWYAAVATVLSASAPRSVYLRCKLMIDRTAGAVLGTLGTKLASSEAVS